MAEDSKKENLNIFIANTIYPEAEAIFKAQYKPLEEIKDDCYVVLDTNALLVPYTTGKDSLDQIKRTYTTLLRSKRLVIPAQVAREFAKNRANKITEIYDQLSKKRDKIQSLETGRYPLLESLEDYQTSMSLEGEVNKLITQYREAVSKVLEHIRSWTWNDPVSLLYNELFSESVVRDITISEKDTKDDLARRQAHKIPPGYKDASKDDEGIGDLLIWQTILEVGKAHERSVIFVSGEEKPDWWYRSNNQALYPRYELIDEFRRSSDGQSFHIVKFSKFLDLYGASDKVVEEVREKEVFISHSLTDPLSQTQKFLSVLTRRLAIKDWLSLIFPEAKIFSQTELPDFILHHPDGTRTAVSELFVPQNTNFIARVSTKISNVRDLLSDQYENVIVVVIARNEHLAYLLSNKISKIESPPDEVMLALGYVDGNKFVTVFTFNERLAT
jgi:rRNA-processing protein FCF1